MNDTLPDTAEQAEDVPHLVQEEIVYLTGTIVSSYLHARTRDSHAPNLVKKIAGAMQDDPVYRDTGALYTPTVLHLMAKTMRNQFTRPVPDTDGLTVSQTFMYINDDGLLRETELMHKKPNDVQYVGTGVPLNRRMTDLLERIGRQPPVLVQGRRFDDSLTKGDHPEVVHKRARCGWAFFEDLDEELQKNRIKASHPESPRHTFYDNVKSVIGSLFGRSGKKHDGLNP